jgi:DNA-binding GntR family transcriptional regulator
VTEGEVDHHDPIPVYQQLAAIIRGQIQRGELAPRSALPSESYLQQRYGVSRGTARKAVELLRSEGIVYTVPQRGTYVAEKRANDPG